MISLFWTVQSKGQVALLKEIKFKPNPKQFVTRDSSIIFPIVHTKNPQVDKLINSQIKIDLFEIEDEKQSLRSIINEQVSDYGLINLDYAVTYNNNGLLSFSINAEGCGAHCSLWTTYFNFDLKTGKKITINDIFLIDKIDSFTSIVKADKINALTNYKKEENTYFTNQDIDSITYDWAISQVDDHCINQVSIETFSISSNSIEVIDPCEFPHAIRSQQPLLELKYTYSSISEFLKPKYKSILK